MQFNVRRLGQLIGVALLLAVMFAVPAGRDVEARSPSMSFAIEDGVNSQDADFVVEGLILAEDFFTTQIGAIFEEPFQVRVQAGSSAESPGLLAYWDGNQVVVLTGSPVWQTSIPAERIATIVHEFTHVYQSAMTGFDDVASPAWFEEGVAEYLSYALLDQLGILDHADMLAFDTSVTAKYMEGVSLDQIHGWRDFQNQGADVYGLSHVAVSRLMEGKPFSTVSLYYTMLRDGYPIDQIYSNLFGVSLSDFSIAMDAYFAGWNQPYEGQVLDELIDTPVEEPSMIHVTSSPASVQIGDQILITGVTEPAVVCALDIGLPNAGSPLIERSTFADGLGEVFWLVTIPESVDTGLVTIQASCGAAPETRAAVVGG